MGIGGPLGGFITDWYVHACITGGTVSLTALQARLAMGFPIAAPYICRVVGLDVDKSHV